LKHAVSNPSGTLHQRGYGRSVTFNPELYVLGAWRHY
jgi:hypothetical protein